MLHDRTLKTSVFRAIYKQNLSDAHYNRYNLINSSKNSRDYVQRLGLLCHLPVHSGCVNTVHWNSTGEYLISGSDDQFIAVTNPHNQQVLLKYRTAHRANIFSARFMPQSNDQAIVSCSGDGIVLHTELMAPYIRRARPTSYPSASINFMSQTDSSPPIYERVIDNDSNVSCFNCHKSGTTYEVLTMPLEPRSFMSCGEDGTVRLFDLRVISNCHKTCCKDNILIFSPAAINAMDLAPITNHYLAVGSSDAIVRIYDRRYLSVIDFNDGSVPANDRHTRPVKAYTIPLAEPNKRHYRITCVRYSPEESELLVSYSSEYLYLFDLNSDGVDVKELQQNKLVEKNLSQPSALSAELVTRRLRLRGDWSDTGPEARPEHDPNGRSESGQFRPQLQANIMSRMTEVISRMLNDPRTPRLGLTNPLNQLQGSTTQENSLNVGITNDRDNDDTNVQNTNSRPSTSAAAWRNLTLRSLFNRSNNSSATVTATTIPSDEDNTTTAITAASVITGAGTVHNTNAISEMHTETNEAREPGTETETATTTTTTTSTISSPFHHEDDNIDDDDTASINRELPDLAIGNTDVVYDYMKMKYIGHRNARTMIKEATFWGTDYVMSGSDCGHIFIWHRRTGELVMLMQADKHVVNCLQPHPELPYLASSGIDYDVKIWAPILPEKGFNEIEAENLMKRNAIMLEQTRDTITVPAAFMIRMLACIHSLRNRDHNSSTSSSDANNQQPNQDQESATSTTSNNSSMNNSNNMEVNTQNNDDIDNNEDDHEVEADAANGNDTEVNANIN